MPTVVSSLKTWFDQKAKPVIEQNLKTIEEALTDAQKMLMNESQSVSESIAQMITKREKQPEKQIKEPQCRRDQTISEFSKSFVESYNKGKDLRFFVDTRKKIGMPAKTKGVGVSRFFEDNLVYDEEALISLDALWNRYRRWVAKSPYNECSKRKLGLFLDPKMVKSIRANYKGVDGQTTVTFYRGVRFKRPCSCK